MTRCLRAAHSIPHPYQSSLQTGTRCPNLEIREPRCQSQQPPHSSPRSPQAPELGYRPSSGWLFLVHEYHLLGAGCFCGGGSCGAKGKAGLRLDGGRNRGDPLSAAGCRARSRANHHASPGQGPRVEVHLLLSHSGRQPAAT